MTRTRRDRGATTVEWVALRATLAQREDLAALRATLVEGLDALDRRLVPKVPARPKPKSGVAAARRVRRLATPATTGVNGPAPKIRRERCPGRRRPVV